VESSETRLGDDREIDRPREEDDLDIFAVAASRVRKWDERDADTEAWRNYRELMTEAESVASFVTHFPQRSVDLSDNTNPAPSVPQVPFSLPILAKLAAEATQTGDAEWASDDSVRSLLTEDVVYNTMEGQRVCGRDAVVEKMNRSVEKLARRFKMNAFYGSGSGRDFEKKTGGAEGRPRGKTPDALPKSASRVKVKSEGFTRSFDHKGREIWIVHYAFDLLLMKVRVRETFRVDGQGKIKEFTRSRA
jgi:hypothetical protein